MLDIDTRLRLENLRFEKSLILNPTENIPSLEALLPASSFMHGLYISDKRRGDDAKVIFAGRSSFTDDILEIYEQWKILLGASSISMKLLSGLNSHIIVFMGLGDIGDKILLLPEQGGGHFSTKGILERLGYEVFEIVMDNDNLCIDIDETKKIIDLCKPQFIFIDRSEGLYYENFYEIAQYSDAYCIFDASQYLTNILTGDFINPFDMGFDLIVSSLHKNFPGPQKAIVFSNNNDEYWKRIDDALDQYISNFHAYGVYIAGLLINNMGFLKEYSKNMILNALSLEIFLLKEGLPVIERSKSFQPTQHVWFKAPSKDENFIFFKKMEACGILTNYRLLPYGLGYGIRLGTPGATLQGLDPSETQMLASLINKIYKNDINDALIEESQLLIEKIKTK